MNSDSTMTYKDRFYETLQSERFIRNEHSNFAHYVWKHLPASMKKEAYLVNLGSAGICGNQLDDTQPIPISSEQKQQLLELISLWDVQVVITDTQVITYIQSTESNPYTLLAEIEAGFEIGSVTKRGEIFIGAMTMNIQDLKNQYLETCLNSARIQCPNCNIGMFSSSNPIILHCSQCNFTYNIENIREEFILNVDNPYSNTLEKIQDYFNQT